MENEKKEEVTTMNQLIDRMMEESASSSVYKKIAAYIEQNYMQIIFMTADELATKLSISQGSVSKFCIAIGYRGYAQFIRNLQKIVGKEITAPERFIYTSRNVHHTDDIIENEIENLRQLKEVIGREEYRKLVEIVSGRKEIILLSARMSATVLPYLKYMLDKLRDGVKLITPESNEWDYIHLREDKENIFVLAVAMPRYPRVLINKLKQIRESGIDIGAITDSRFSPVCQNSSINIFIPRTVASIFDIYSSLMAFMNIFATDISKNIPDVQRRLDLIEKQDAESRIYYSK